MFSRPNAGQGGGAYASSQVASIAVSIPGYLTPAVYEPVLYSAVQLLRRCGVSMEKLSLSQLPATPPGGAAMSSAVAATVMLQLAAVALSTMCWQHLWQVGCCLQESTLARSTQVLCKVRHMSLLWGLQYAL